MLKKILGILAVSMISATSIVSAMQFSQPEEIGKIYRSQTLGGWALKGTSSNDGNFYRTNVRNQNNTETYEKGIACFGDGDDALYIYYDANQERDEVALGGKDPSKAISVKCFNEWIFKIESDESITLYVFHFRYGGEAIYRIYGKKADGSFVKYIDMNDLIKEYLGNGGYPYWFGDLKSDGDTITTSYKTRNNSKCEFRFKWDESAQWFSVEQVIY